MIRILLFGHQVVYLCSFPGIVPKARIIEHVLRGSMLLTYRPFILYFKENSAGILEEAG